MKIVFHKNNIFQIPSVTSPLKFDPVEFSFDVVLRFLSIFTETVNSVTVPRSLQWKN